MFFFSMFDFCVCASELDEVIIFPILKTWSWLYVECMLCAFGRLGRVGAGAGGAWVAV